MKYAITTAEDWEWLCEVYMAHADLGSLVLYSSRIDGLLMPWWDL